MKNSKEAVEVTVRIPHEMLLSLRDFERRAGSQAALTEVCTKMVIRHLEAHRNECVLAAVPQKSWGIIAEVADLVHVSPDAVLETCVSGAAERLVDYRDTSHLERAIEDWQERGLVKPTKMEWLKNVLAHLSRILKQRDYLGTRLTRHACKL